MNKTNYMGEIFIGGQLLFVLVGVYLQYPWYWVMFPTEFMLFLVFMTAFLNMTLY